MTATALSMGRVSADTLFAAATNTDSGHYEIVTYPDTSGIVTGPGSIFATNSTSYSALAFDSGLNLYASSDADHTIYRYPYSNGVLSSTPAVFSVIADSEPAGMAFDRQGDLFVADYYNDVIYEYGNNDGTLSASPITFTSDNLINPTALAFDDSGNLFVADPSSHEIVQFPFLNGQLSPNGTALTSTGLVSPNGIAAGTDGSLYVSDYTNGIFRYTLADIHNGSAPSLLSSDNSANPDAVAFDLVGNLFAANTSGDNVVEFVANNGTVSNSSNIVVTMIDHPTSIAIELTVVPEPENWIILWSIIVAYAIVFLPAANR